MQDLEGVEHVITKMISHLNSACWWIFAGSYEADFCWKLCGRLPHLFVEDLCETHKIHLRST